MRRNRPLSASPNFSCSWEPRSGRPTCWYGADRYRPRAACVDVTLEEMTPTTAVVVLIDHVSYGRQPLPLGPFWPECWDLGSMPGTAHERENAH
jgi:hypothetical protein